MSESNEVTVKPPAIVVLDGVGMDFDDQKILRAINLSIEPGQTVAIIGESGCGKTVTLKLIVALLRPTVGKVWLEGTNLTELSERQLIALRLRVGFLFQGAALFDSMTVEENIGFGLKSQKLPREIIQERIQRRLYEVGLNENALKKFPSELSGGMKKRVGLARALVLNPEVMLYDEPTTGLDPIMTDVINELIGQTRRDPNITSIVVTHEMRTVQKVADRVVMLYPLSRLQPHEPQILFDGSVEQLMNCQDQRVRQFVEGRAGDRLSGSV
jgi:phospholipid/cholesterol/gamma-HCH transport system ATP-binding protein